MHLKEVGNEAEACAFCNLMCRHVCSVGTTVKYESAYPVGKGRIAYSVLKGYRRLDEGVAKRMYLCNDCGRCRTWCKTGISDCSRVVNASRADLVEKDLAPPSIISWRENSREHNNIYGVKQDVKFSGIQGVDRRDGDLLYFIGCTTAYYHPEIAVSTIRILDALGVDYSTLGGEEWCCGHPLYASGFRAEAKRLAEHNKAHIEGMGVKKILASCPECYVCLKDEYKRWGFTLKPDIEYLTAYISKIGGVRFKYAGDMTVAYHDPCYLSRRAGIIEEPRAILSKIPGVNLVELKWNRHDTYCCGWGGALHVTNPEVAEKISRKVLNMAFKTGVGTLISSCPFCKESFTRSAYDDITVMDVSEVVAGSLT